MESKKIISSKSIHNLTVSDFIVDPCGHTDKGHKFSPLEDLYGTLWALVSNA